MPAPPRHDEWASSSAYMSSPARLRASIRSFLSADHRGRESIGVPRPVEILLGQPAFAVRAVRQRHALVAHENVGMMVGAFRVEREPRDKSDRVRKRAELELPADRVAAQL